MKRRITITLVALGLLLGLVPLQPAATAESTPRRVVSLVYDDSGSMYGSTKWASTNYAMQAFVSLLDQSDELYVTYLSDYTTTMPDKSRLRNLRLKERQGTIDVVRAFPGVGTKFTPFAAVITAAELLGRQPTSEGTESWLVVLTDGMFTDLSPNVSAANLLYELQSQLQGQGKNCKLMYLAIGEDAVPIPSNEAQGFYSAVTNERDIAVAMASMASIISGAAQVSPNSLTTSGTTLSINSPLPLRSLQVLTQKQTPSIQKASHSKNSALRIGEAYSLSYPEETSMGDTDRSLVGRVTNVYPASGVLPAGAITLTFSEPVNISGTVVLFEPAVAMTVVLLRDGQEISPQEISPGDTITAKIRIIDEATGAPIPPSALPHNPRYGITIRDSSGTERTLNTDSLVFTAEPGSLELSAWSSMPGAFELRSYHQTQVRKVQLAIDKTTSWAGALANLKGISPLSAQVLIDGRPATTEEMERMKISIRAEKPLRFEVEKHGAKASFMVRPKYNLLKALTPSGHIPVVLTLNTGRPGETIAETIDLTITDMPWHQKLQAPFLLLLCSFFAAGYLTKPRFDKNRAHLEHWSENVSGFDLPEEPRTRRFEPDAWSRIIPFAPETCSVGGVRLKAGKSRDHIVLPKSSQGSHISIGGATTQKTHPKDIIITRGQVLEVKRNDRIYKYRYKV